MIRTLLETKNAVEKELESMLERIFNEVFPLERGRLDIYYQDFPYEEVLLVKVLQSFKDGAIRILFNEEVPYDALETVQTFVTWRNQK